MADIPTTSPVGAHGGRVGDRIVVGVDGSPGAECALLWAADDAARRHGVLEVVHCWQAAPATTPGAVALSDHVAYLLAGAGQKVLVYRLNRAIKAGLLGTRFAREGHGEWRDCRFR
ncbi:MAG: universal stress protein [Actinomycetota bacterium]|nr:universal stress protein [Actinomycetota bacterium]